MFAFLKRAHVCGNLSSLLKSEHKSPQTCARFKNVKVLNSDIFGRENYQAFLLLWDLQFAILYKSLNYRKNSSIISTFKVVQMFFNESVNRMYS